MPFEALTLPLRASGTPTAERKAKLISDRLAGIEPVLDAISRAQEAALQGFHPRLRAERNAPLRPPLLAPGEVEVDRDAFARLLGEVFAALRDWVGGDAEDEARTGPSLEVDDSGLRTLLEACIEGGEALALQAEAFGADAEVFVPAVRCAFAPFLRAHADELGDKIAAILGETDLPGRCPVCGSEPAMAGPATSRSARSTSSGVSPVTWGSDAAQP